MLTGGGGSIAPYMAKCPVCNGGTDARSPRNCDRAVAPSAFTCPHCAHTLTFYLMGDIVSCGACGLWSHQDGTVPRCSKESNVGRCVSQMYHTTSCTFTETVPLADPVESCPGCNGMRGNHADECRVTLAVACPVYGRPAGQRCAMPAGAHVDRIQAGAASR